MGEKKRPLSLVLLSGGIDSAACVRYYLDLGFRVEGLFIDYGQSARQNERKSATKIAKYYGIPLDRVSLSSNNDFGPGEIRGRNAFFIVSALMAKPKLTGLLALGIHSGSLYYDCGEKFINLMRELVTDYTDGTVQLDFPLIEMDKREIYDYCGVHNVPLELTYSCELGTVPPCGSCPSCRDRIAVESNL